MKNVLLIFLFSLTGVACENCDPGDDVYPACSVNEPVEGLAWLREEIQNREQDFGEYAGYQYIQQAAHEGETVFIYRDCNPLANSVVPVLNCSGETIGYLGDQEEDIDFAILDSAFTIWQPEDFACSQ